MAHVIHKYPIDSSSFTLDLPDRCRILTVQTQFNKAQMWIMLDELDEHKPRRFKLLGTGWYCDECKDWTYVGTVQYDGGVGVYHLFHEPVQ